MRLISKPRLRSPLAHIDLRACFPACHAPVEPARRFGWILLATLLAGPFAALGANLRLLVEAPAIVTEFTAIEIELTVHNDGPDTVILDNFPLPEALNMKVSRAGGSEPFYQGRVLLPPRFPSDIVLRPIPLRYDESARFRVPLGVRWSSELRTAGALFEQPGIYRLSFEYPAQTSYSNAIVTTRLTSDPIEIRVEPPTQNEGPALLQLRRVSHPEWVLDPEEALSEATAAQQELLTGELKDFVQRWPVSPWTPLARFTLAFLLKNRALATPNDPQVALLTEASNHAATLRTLTNFPHNARARSLEAFLAKTLQKETQRARSEAKAKAKAAMTAETKAVLLKDLQILAEAVASGDAKLLESMFAEDFVLGSRLNRAQAIEQITRDRARLGNEAVQARAELMSIEPEGSVYVVQARFEFKTGTQTDSQTVLLKGVFAEGAVWLHRWDRITPGISDQKR